jgi:hypothetical protein
VEIELAPADVPLDVPVNASFSLSVPPAVLAGGGRLSVSPAQVQRPDVCGTFESLGLFDVTLLRDGAPVHELPAPIEMVVRFDPAQLDHDLPPEEQLLAAHWDEERQVWVEDETDIDVQRGLIVARATHLSVRGWLSWINSKAIVAFEPITHFSDQITRIKGFNLLYDPAELATKASIKGWRGESSFPAAYQHLWSAKTPGYSCFIRDVAYYLAQSYDAYTRDKLGDLPIRPVLVKLGPGMAGSDIAQFDHVALCINVSTDRISSSRTTLKHALAHEMYHAFQNTMLAGDADKIVAPATLWWIEGTAEYAACRIAWTLDTMGSPRGPFDGIYPYLLERPVTESGTFVCPHGWPDVDEIEYDRGYLLDYMVQQGVAFAPLYKAVMEQYGTTGQPLHPFETHLLQQGPLPFPPLYRGFVGWFLFAEGSPRGRSTQPDPINSTPDRLAATLADQPLALPPAQLAAPYTAICQAVRLDPKAKEPVAIEVLATALDDWALIDLYILPDGARVANPSPVATLNDTRTPAQVTLAPGQTLYGVALNLANARSATAAVELRPGPSDWYEGWLAARPPQNGTHYTLYDDLLYVSRDGHATLMMLNFQPPSLDDYDYMGSLSQVPLIYDKQGHINQPADHITGRVSNKGRRVEITFIWEANAISLANGAYAVLPELSPRARAGASPAQLGYGAGSATVVYSIPIAEPGR